MVAAYIAVHICCKEAGGIQAYIYITIDMSYNYMCIGGLVFTKCSAGVSFCTFFFLVETVEGWGCYFFSLCGFLNGGHGEPKEGENWSTHSFFCLQKSAEEKPEAPPPQLEAST